MRRARRGIKGSTGKEVEVGRGVGAGVEVGKGVGVAVNLEVGVGDGMKAYFAFFGLAVEVKVGRGVAVGVSVTGFGASAILAEGAAVRGGL